MNLNLDAHFDAHKEDIRKSNLLLQAALLREEGQFELAAARFAEVADLEEKLALFADAQSNPEGAIRHRFSAASGWAHAGDFHHALSLLTSLEAQAETPQPLRERVHEFAETVRAQRDQWHRTLREAHLLV